MPEFSSYPPGTPSWVDLSTSDVNGAARFYGELLGWETAEDGGGHRTFTLRGKPVAGCARVHEEGELPAWLTYIASDDVDATARRAGDAGGQVVMPPFDVADAGRSTVLADATGAVFAVWQGGGRAGGRRGADPARSWPTSPARCAGPSSRRATSTPRRGSTARSSAGARRRATWV